MNASNASALKTACAIITALFIASAPATAQVAPRVPALVAALGAYDHVPETALVLPKTGSNYYLNTGLAYARANIGDRLHPREGTGMFGVNAAFGWRITAYNKVQLDMGVLRSAAKAYPTRGAAVANKVTYSAIPLIASHSLCVPLEKNRRWELRLTPAIGGYTVTANYNQYIYAVGGAASGVAAPGAAAGSGRGVVASRVIARAPYPPAGQNWVQGFDAGVAFAYGGGIGVTRHVDERFYVDAGCRVLAVGSVAMDYTTVKSQTTHTIIVSFGWKF